MRVCENTDIGVENLRISSGVAFCHLRRKCECSTLQESRMRATREEWEGIGKEVKEGKEVSGRSAVNLEERVNPVLSLAGYVSMLQIRR